MNNLFEALNKTNEQTSKPYLYWEIARVVEEAVNCIPLRPTRRRPGDDTPHSRGLRYYRPWFLSHYNSASNLGTANLVTKIVEWCLDRLLRGYIFIRGDIYMKILRVTMIFVLQIFVNYFLDYV